MAKSRFYTIVAAFAVSGIIIGTGASVNVYAETKCTSAANQSAQSVKMPECKPMSSEEMAKNLKAKLDPLVKAGTITQAQEDKIISYMKIKHEERIAEMNKVKNMTESERKAYFENKKKNKPGMFKELVNSNVINKSQADAIKKAIGHKGFMGEKNFENKYNLMKSKFDSAVKDGTITQTQEDKILAYIKQLDKNRRAEREKVKAMTEAEREAYFKSKGKTAKPDLFSDLVNNGTITRAQADKLKKLMPVCPKGSGKHLYQKENKKGTTQSDS